MSRGADNTAWCSPSQQRHALVLCWQPPQKNTRAWHTFVCCAATMVGPCTLCVGCAGRLWERSSLLTPHKSMSSITLSATFWRWALWGAPALGQLKGRAFTGKLVVRKKGGKATRRHARLARAREPVRLSACGALRALEGRARLGGLNLARNAPDALLGVRKVALQDNVAVHHVPFGRLGLRGGRPRLLEPQVNGDLRKRVGECGSARTTGPCGGGGKERRRRNSRPALQKGSSQPVQRCVTPPARRGSSCRRRGPP